MKQKPEAPEKTHLLFVDSVEAGVARLIAPGTGDDTPSYAFPAALLPSGSGEGAWIEVRVRAAAAPPGHDNAGLRQRLGQKDDGGDFSL